VLARLAVGLFALAIIACGRQEMTTEDSGSKPAWQLEWEAEQRDVLAGADFPVYAPEGLRVELSGSGGGDGEPVDDVRLSHYVDEQRQIDVSSEIDADEVVFEDEVTWMLRDHARGEVVPATRRFPVDGAERPFTFASAGDRWAAVAKVGDVTITVTARGIDPGEVRLRALADPTSVIDGNPSYRPHRPDFDVLDRRRVAELAESTPLADLGPKLAEVARPAIALLPAKGAQPSWLGGEPHLPAGTRWPRGTHGAMTFLAQLSLADLDRSVWTGPASGHLHVFCDLDEDHNMVEAAGACRVLHSPAGAELSAPGFPSDLGRYNRLSPQMVQPSVGLTVPDPWTPVMRKLGLELEDPAAADALWALNDRLAAEQGWQFPAGRLLGWGRWQNDDNMAYLAELGGGKADDWTLLLQTDALNGELYVALPTADLAAGRFDRAQAILEYD
jgi:hypothetical protein